MVYSPLVIIYQVKISDPGLRFCFLLKAKDLIKGKMTPAKTAKTQKLAREWMKKIIGRNRK